jgi:guanosine-3',5'-bis(diphosphate) 3'-pyrophosphohydrolase
MPIQLKAKRTKTLNSERPELFQEAAAFAARAHRHQLRKDGRTPYISHLTRVALTLTQVFWCDDAVTLAAALLHDTIEDTTTDYDDLHDRFGKQVADAVAALTKNMTLPEKEREEEYHNRMARADWRVRLVKLADVYDNYSDVHTWPKEKQAEQRRKALEKCQEALKIARTDGKDPVMATAIQAVERLIATDRKRRS